MTSTIDTAQRNGKAIDVDAVKQAARGRWGEIIASLCGVPADILDGRHHPCPRPGCGGTDRFRTFDDFAETGGVICNQCHQKGGDGFNTLQWLLDCDFREALSLVADNRGIESNGHRPKPRCVLETVATEKKVSADALRAYGATVEANAVVVPMFGPDGQQCSTYTMKPGRKGLNEKGKPSGVFLPHVDGKPRLPQPGESWLGGEGCKDSAKLWQLDYLAVGFPGRQLGVEFAAMFAGVDVVLVPDRDEVGETGANTTAARLRGYASTVKIAVLPAEFTATKGADVRDVCSRTDGEAHLREAIDKAQVWQPTPEQVQEHIASQLPPVAYAQGQTDAANAKRFIDVYNSELLYIPPWKKWLSWDGHRWSEDCGVGVLQRAERYADDEWQHMATAARFLERGELAKMQTAIRNANQQSGISAFIRLAAVDERVVCPVEELNSDPTLLNVANGTIDLTTGKLRPHNPADRITQLANVVYDPDALCPRWQDTLNLIFDGKGELIRYVQQLLGYSISGDTGEHILPIAHGNGNNGKSTIWNVVTDLLGDYSSLAHDELLLGERNNHPTEKAALYQKRFVAISEPERGTRLKESRVKELTGDRWITARRCNEDFWTFQRTHTFWLSTNYLPRIDGTDEGIWRRVKRLPFIVDLRDKVTPILDFDRWLVANEGPGILAWLVRGYLDYREHGFIEPDCVKRATDNYRGESDPLGEYLDEYCVVEDDAEETAKELFRVYCDLHSGKWSQKAFGIAMAERFTRDRPTTGIYRHKTIYRGVRLRDASDDSETVNDEF